MEAKVKKRWITFLISSGIILSVLWMLFLRPSNSLSSYVPEHAAWYLETRNPLKLLQDVESSILPFSDSGLSLVKQLQEGAGVVTHLMESRQDLLSVLKEGPFGISSHSISGNEAGYVFYLASTKEIQDGLMEFLSKRFRNLEGYRIEKREYLGEKILEISKKGGRTFSISFLKNALVASFSGFLLEEVIRSSGVSIKPGFAIRLSRDPRFRHIENKNIHFFINNAVFPVFLKEFLLNPEPEMLRHPAEAMVFGIDRFSGMELRFQGFALSRRGSGSGGKLLNPGLREVLPSGLEVLSFQLAIKDLWADAAGSGKADDGKSLLLGKALQDELLLALLEGQGLKKYDHILVAEVRNQAGLEQVMQMIAGSESSPYVYKEDYRGFALYKHRNNQLASEIAGKQLSGWAASCYAVFGSKLVICDQMELLRQCADVQVENPKPPAVSGKASTVLLEASPGRMIPYFMENSAGPLRRYLKEWLPLAKSVTRFHLSDEGEPENPSLSLTISLGLENQKPDSLQPLAKIFIDSTIVSAPFRLQTGPENGGVWLLQDCKKQVHFLDDKLNLISTVSMPDFWLNEPLPIMRTAKTAGSVLISLPKSTMVFSENGSTASGFSLNLPDSLSALNFCSLIDYDHSFQYRLFSASRYGFVLASDESGRLLPGWNPRKLSAPLAQAPRHIRIAGKDYILMLDKAGNLLLTNRKGEMQPGFPYKLKGDSYSSVFLEAGLEEENSFVYCLSELGQMEKVSLSGKQVSFLQLFRPEVNTRFTLCPDQKGRTFVVARQGSGSVTLFDQSYRPVLEFKSAGKHFAIRHFQFGSTNKIYAISDLDTRQGQLFNESGLPILKTTFQTSGPVEIIPAEQTPGRYRLLSVFENRAVLSGFVKN
jgi:hypothetical protein